MARTDIHHEDKKRELAKRLWDIFMKYGYENATLALIIKELDISKGAFYHYFPSKEECANVAVELFATECRDIVFKKIQQDLPAIEKLKQLFFYGSSLAQENEKDNKNINSPSNSVFHQKLMAMLVKILAPVYAAVIEQGIKEGVFNTKFPIETAEMILTISNFYFDTELFHWNPDEFNNKLAAFKELLALSLQAEQNKFNFLENML